MSAIDFIERIANLRHPGEEEIEGPGMGSDELFTTVCELVTEARELVGESAARHAARRGGAGGAGGRDVPVRFRPRALVRDAKPSQP